MSLLLVLNEFLSGYRILIWTLCIFSTLKIFYCFSASILFLRKQQQFFFFFFLFFKSSLISWAWLHMPVVPNTWRTEMGGSLEIAPLYSSLCNRARLCLKREKKNSVLLFPVPPWIVKYYFNVEFAFPLKFLDDKFLPHFSS